MTPSAYILQSLEELRDAPSVPSLRGRHMADHIYSFLLSNRYRKYSVNPEYLAHIRSAIEQSVGKNEPIKMTLVFGGYKLWRLPEFPEPDWAELFSLMYYVQWLRPVAAVYAPGIWFDFYSDDVILEVMDNIPKNDTETYIQKFRDLLLFIKPYTPENCILTLNRVGDQYDSYTEFVAELDRSKRAVETALGGLPRLTPEQAALVEMNVRPSPGQTEDPFWREKVFLIHEAYARASRRRPYYRTNDKIFVGTHRMKDALSVGTTKTSVVKFWIGAGVLEVRGDSYVRHVVAPKRLTSDRFHTMAVSIKGLSGKNFSSIRVIG